MRKIIEEMLAGTQPETDLLAATRGKALGDLPAELRPDLATLRPAAVLVPLMEYPDELTVLLTQRTDHLPEHPGQVAFPGGRQEPEDGGPLEAALRESEEEIGLPRGYVRPVGYLPPYLTITGYAVTPVVGFVRPGFELRPDPVEVADVFEVPLGWLMDTTNQRLETREFRGRSVSYYVMPYSVNGREYRIWGATAAMLVDFSNRVTRAMKEAG